MPRFSLTARDQQVNEIVPATRRVRRRRLGSAWADLYGDSHQAHSGVFRTDLRTNSADLGHFRADHRQFPIPLSTGDSEHDSNRATNTGTYAAQRADANTGANIRMKNMTKKTVKQKDQGKDKDKDRIVGNMASQTVEALFKDGLKADGSINGRSSLGAHFRAVKAGLDKGEVAGEVLSRLIGLDLLLLRVVEAEIVAHPDKVLVDGRLSQTITSDLAGLKTSLRQNLKEYDTLRATRAKEAGGGGGKGRPGRKNLEKIFIK